MSTCCCSSGEPGQVQKHRQWLFGDGERGRCPRPCQGLGPHLHRLLHAGTLQVWFLRSFQDPVQRPDGGGESSCSGFVCVCACVCITLSSAADHGRRTPTSGGHRCTWLRRPVPSSSQTSPWLQWRPSRFVSKPSPATPTPSGSVSPRCLPRRVSGRKYAPFLPCYHG